MDALGMIAFWSPFRWLRMLIAKRFGTPINEMPGWVHIGSKTCINLNSRR